MPVVTCQSRALLCCSPCTCWSSSRTTSCTRPPSLNMEEGLRMLGPTSQEFDGTTLSRPSGVEVAGHDMVVELVNGQYARRTSQRYVDRARHRSPEASTRRPSALLVHIILAAEGSK